MKFLMSYSCGKDSTLALHKMIADGNIPLGCLVMINETNQRSYFHGVDTSLLKQYEKALGIPFIPCLSGGEEYHLKMEERLREGKAQGASAVVFGDIDIEDNREWAMTRAKNAGLDAIFPLWHHDRKANVLELIKNGYTCVIKSIQNTLLPEKLLGMVLNEETIRIMDDAGIDICGENGEYHTLVVNGPIFKEAIKLKKGEILRFGNFSIMDMRLSKK